MKWGTVVGILAAAHLSSAHEAHEAVDGKTAEEFAREHMASEHHIDAFDLKSFFQLHDLDRNRVWDRAEIEAVYGVHHEYSKKKTPTEEAQQEKANKIVQAVLDKLDTNHDGVINVEEFEAGGWDGLQSFRDLGADGHHYDVESEFFLHHEEVYHSTPETQTDESYTHAEDLEHFSRHEAIELAEENKERKFQGLPPLDHLPPHEGDGSPPQPPVDHDNPAGQDTPTIKTNIGIKAAGLGGGTTGQKPFVRQPPPEKQDPKIRFRDAEQAAEAKAEWGQGEEGYKRPRSASDKLRKNLPYKYRFRRSYGDF